MKKEVKELLINLGLNPIEIRVFLASLETGSSPASTIAKVSNLNRVTTYEALKRLSKKGFVKIRAKKNNSVKYFVPEDIETIKDKLEDKKNDLDKNIKDIDDMRDELKAMFIVNEDKPIVLFFEGKEGIKEVLKDTLKQKPGEILSFASIESLEKGFDDKFLQKYWEKRVSLNIRTRGILPKTDKSAEKFDSHRNKQELRELKFIPREDFDFKNEIDIYGDNVGIISTNKSNEHGVIIRSKSVADSMRAVFNAMWGTQI